MVFSRPKLHIDEALWLCLMKELRSRGKGERESGAFLLARENSKTVSEFICYDDLDPDCLTGMIEFSASGFGKLWKICYERNLRVIADVHTHPSIWTNQSITDKHNPMVCMRGHLALIIPSYAQAEPQLLKGVGIFEYRGSFKWKKHRSAVIKLKKNGN